MKAQDIMTKDPSVVTPTASVREAASIMKEENVGIVPVVESNADRTLIGVITDRDIAIRCIAEGRDGTCHVSEVMSADRITTCTPDDEVEDIMGAMRSEQVRRIPIVDERGSLVGIVAQADVVRKADDEKKAADTIGDISRPPDRHSQ